MRWCTILLVQEICVFIFLVLGTHGLITKVKPGTTDYVSFYAAGHLANIGQAPLAYNHAAHYAAEVAATQPGIQYVFFFYPPVFLLLCSLLARLPYLLSFVVFDTVTLTLYLTALRAILGARGWRWMIPVLSFPVTFFVLGWGQNSFLTAALLGLGTVFLERRPIAAGLMFGLICYKPHFGILIPLVLIVGGYWRAIFGAVISVVATVALSWAMFGSATWMAFWHGFASSPLMYQSGRIPFEFFITPFGAARLMSLPPALAYDVQIIVSVAVAILVGWIWRSDTRPAIRGASLIAGTLLVVPLALVYDLLIAMVAMAWLVAGLHQEGLLRGEKLAFVAIYAISVLASGIAEHLGIPLGVLPGILLLAICALRCLRERSLAAA